MKYTAIVLSVLSIFFAKAYADIEVATLHDWSPKRKAESKKSSNVIYQLGIISLGSGYVHDSADNAAPFGMEILSLDSISHFGLGIHISPLNFISYNQKIPLRHYANSAIIRENSGNLTVRTASMHCSADSKTTYYLPFIFRYYFYVKTLNTNAYCGAGLSYHRYKKYLSTGYYDGVSFEGFDKNEEDIIPAFNIGFDSLKRRFHPAMDILVLPGSDKDEGLLILASLSLKYGF